MNAVIDEPSLPRIHGVRSRPADLLAAVGGAAGIVTVVALVALAAGIDPSGARPFTSLRWAVVSAAICGAAVGARRWALPGWQLAAWPLLIGTVAIGAATGPDPVTAWLGHPQRHLGVFAWVVFALAAAAGAALADRRRAGRALEMVTVVVAGNVAATSIADRLGWDPAGSSFADDRIGGVFGQPVVLATVAVLMLPVVVGCRRVGRARWPIAAGLLLTIGLTQTRGAVVGLVAVALVTAPSWWAGVRAASPTRRIVVVGAVAAGVAVVAISPLGGRLTDSVDSGRTDEWALGVSVIADHPLVGVGPEGYRIEALGHLDADYVERYGRDVVVDRAHSAPLDVALSGGAVAGVVYVALVGSVAVATWRLQRRTPLDDGGRLAFAGGAGAVGVFAAGLVAFPVPEVDAVAWLFAGLALGAMSQAIRPPDRAAGSVGVGVRVLAGAALVVATVAGVTDVIADHRMDDALAAAANGRTAAAIEAAERAVDLRPDLVDAHYVAATAAASGPTILDVDRAIDFVTAGLDRFPRDPALRDLHTRLLVDRAVRSGLDADGDAAVAALDALEADDPTSLVVQSGTERLVEACLVRCENKP